MKLKNIIALLLSIIMCLSLAGCGADDSGIPEGMKVLEQASDSYTIYIPQDWVADVSTGFASAYVSNTDPSNISFMAYTVPGDETLADGTAVNDLETFWKSYEEDFKKTFSDMEYESFGEDTSAEGESTALNYTNVKLDGLDARKYVFHATVGGEEYTFLMVAAMGGSDVYLLTYTASRDNFEAHLDEVDSVIANFKFN